MSVELNEARRHVAELRTRLTEHEANLSELKLALHGVGDPSALCVKFKLGDLAEERRAAFEDVGLLRTYRPTLERRIEDCGVAIQAAMVKLREIEATEPQRHADQVGNAKAALVAIRAFEEAGSEVDRALRAYGAARAKLDMAAAEAAGLGHPVCGAAQMKLIIGRILDAATKGTGLQLGSVAGAVSGWAERAKRNVEAILESAKEAA